MVALLSLLLLPTAARAVFHTAHITEVMSGAGSDPSVQFVEIRMDTVGQGNVMNTRLTAFNCNGTSSAVLLLVPKGVTNQSTNARWIMGSTSFAAAAGITPDFTWDPATTGSIPTPCGMVCWGAPGTFFVPAPGTWDPTDPNQYVDCVAYGGYTGPTKTSTHDGTSTSGTPTMLGPGNGTQSLGRVTNTGNNSADFALQCPDPTNNAGNVGTIGTCTAPSTTTSTTTVPTTPVSGTTSTTTTTTPPTGGTVACSDRAAFAAVRAMIAAQCPCSGSHGAYVRCAAHVAAAAAKGGTLPKACKGAVRTCAAKSTCGKSGFVTCCRTTAKGRTSCSLKPSAAACRKPRNGSSCTGTQGSCCDTCGAGTCPLAAIGSTTTHPRRTTTTMSIY